MIPILEFEGLRPEQILSRDIQAEEDVSRAVDEVIAAVRRDGDKACPPSGSNTPSRSADTRRHR